MYHWKGQRSFPEGVEGTLTLICLAESGKVIFYFPVCTQVTGNNLVIPVRIKKKVLCQFFRIGYSKKSFYANFSECGIQKKSLYANFSECGIQKKKKTIWIPFLNQRCKGFTSLAVHPSQVMHSAGYLTQFKLTSDLSAALLSVSGANEDNGTVK